jgi:hypothetical protein
MHIHEKYIVAALLAAASPAYALTTVTPEASQTPGFSAGTALVPVTAAASLTAGSGALTPPPAEAAVDSFASDLERASRNFGRLPLAPVSLDGTPRAADRTLSNAAAGALPASDPASYGMLLLGAGFTLLAGRRRNDNAPWAVTTVRPHMAA